MRCTKCGFDNPAPAEFCGACGAALTRVCGECGGVNPPNFRFCGQCGKPLADAQTPLAQKRRASDAAGPAVAERRHLTVMFCDLVGSTALSLRLDPEELREVVRSYQSTCAEVIEAYDGYIAQYLGDGILTYFGFPVSLEDESGRAVGAGLDIIQAIAALNAKLDPALGVELAVRIGIHTGLVVVGEIGGGARREHLALGDAPNIAARLQGLASPNSVVVSAGTHHLIARKYECEELEKPGLKGVPDGESVYRVLRRLPFPVHETDTRTAAVGRDQELALMLERWQQAQTGHGQVICVSGDPGIGKSRLLDAFESRTIASCSRLETRCLPFYRNTPFFPFIDLLQREWDCQPPRTMEQRLDAIANQLQLSGFEPEETLSLFSHLLSVSSERAQGTLPPETIKERTREALLQVLLHASTNMPLILVIEDLHWADASTLEVLDRLVAELPARNLLAIFTNRPEFGMRWPARAQVTHIALGRLPQSDVERLVVDVTGGRELPREVLVQIVAKTDGVPLFVEELTRMVLESGLVRQTNGTYELAGPLPPLAIPATLRDSLEARLDRLSRVKDLAQLAATVGREFSFEMMRALSTFPEDALLRALDQLVTAGLLYRHGTPPNVQFQFKHALIQEAAYESLLRSTRQIYHERIVRVLEEKFPETAVTQPEILAYHFTAAGLYGSAVEAWKRAGQRALERSAHPEAVEHLRQGLALIEKLSDAGVAERNELDLLCLLGPALTGARGYTAPEVRTTYLRARELARQSGRLPQLVQVLAGMFAYYFVLSDLDEARGIAEELMELAQKTGDETLSMVAHTALGIAHLGGSLHIARDALAHVIRVYDPARHGHLAVSYGQDFGVVGLAYSGFLYWLTGCADQARDLVQRGVSAAERLGHAHSSALALVTYCTVQFNCRNLEEVRTGTARLRKIAQPHGFKHWMADVVLLEAWIAAQDGRNDEALAALGVAGEMLHAMGVTQAQAFFHPLMIEVYITVGKAQDALNAIDKWENRVDPRHGAWWCESEMHRLRAVALLDLNPDDPNVETALMRALEVARKRRGLSLELRVVIMLARLWSRDARAGEARALLRDCLASFTEGFDTGDLIEANQLLEQLEAVPVS